MIALGIDPDLHATGFAVVDMETVYAVGVVKIPAKHKGDDAVLAMSEALAQLPAIVPSQVTFRAGRLKAIDICVVEGQEIYLGHTKRPDSILRLAQVAGAALAACATLSPFEIHIPRPQRWKGSVPKHIHQTRILGRYGLSVVVHGKGDDRYVEPITPLVKLTNVNKSDWKHVVDAIGLARWGLEQGGVPGMGQSRRQS